MSFAQSVDGITGFVAATRHRFVDTFLVVVAGIHRTDILIVTGTHGGHVGCDLGGWCFGGGGGGGGNGHGRGRFRVGCVPEGGGMRGTDKNGR